MAKRARGTTTRPGQRRPMQRPAARPSAPTVRPGTATTSEQTAAAARPSSLTAEEEARAAELEATIVAQERQAEDARRTRSQRGSEVARAGSPLAVAAANEYAYVARDVRRVALVGGSLVALLLGLWVVVEVSGVGV